VKIKVQPIKEVEFETVSPKQINICVNLFPLCVKFATVPEHGPQKLRVLGHPMMEAQNILIFSLNSPTLP
jgi:hypothetical protein